MSRDRRFEIQYILSLLILLVGFSTGSLSGIIDKKVAIGFTSIGSAHLVLLTTIYSISKATDFDSLSLLKSLKRKSRYTLQMTTLGFLYLLSHGFSNSVLKPFGGPICGMSGETVKIIISFGLPGLFVSMVSGGFLFLAMPSFRTSRDLSLNVVPHSLKVYQEFSDTDELLVEVFNQGSSEYELSLELELPKEVVLQHEGEVHLDSFVYEFELGEERRPFNFNLRHNSTEPKRELIRLTLDNKRGSITDTVDVFLRA